MNKQTHVAVVWMADTKEQLFYFVRSFEAVLKHSTNEAIDRNYYILLKSKGMQRYIRKRISKASFKRIVFLYDKEVNEILDWNKSKFNFILLKVIVPFLVDETKVVFLDNDTIPFSDVADLISDDKSVISRRKWEITENHNSWKFASKFWKIDKVKYFEANGNGGVVVYDNKRYRKIFKDDKKEIIRKIYEYINRIDLYNNDLNNIHKLIYDDEIFHNIHCHKKNNSFLEDVANLTPKMWLDNKVNEKDVKILHLPKNNSYSKKNIYKYLYGKKDVKFLKNLAISKNISVTEKSELEKVFLKIKRLLNN